MLSAPFLAALLVAVGFGIMRSLPRTQPPPVVATLSGTISGLEEGDKAEILIVDGSGVLAGGLVNGEWSSFVGEEGTYNVTIKGGRYVADGFEPLNYTSSPQSYTVEVVEGVDITGLNFTLTKQ